MKATISAAQYTPEQIAERRQLTRLNQIQSLAKFMLESVKVAKESDSQDKRQTGEAIAFRCSKDILNLLMN